MCSHFCGSVFWSIYSCWDDIEKYLLVKLFRQIEYISRTYQVYYSKTINVFLDVKMSKSNEGTLHTSVFGKNTN